MDMFGMMNDMIGNMVRVLCPPPLASPWWWEVGVGKAVFTEACKLDKMARPEERRGPEWKAVAGIS